MITDINQLDLKKQYTYADYQTWQFEGRVELINGWVSKMGPSPMRKHQEVFGFIFNQVFNYLLDKPCKVYAAPFDVRLINKRKKLEEQTILSVVQPDISVICDVAKLDDYGCLGSPDWIIEILNPDNSRKEMKEKHAIYEENGVREYWIVSTTHFFVQVYHLVDEKSVQVGLVVNKLLPVSLAPNKLVLKETYFKGDKIPVGIFPGFIIDSEKMFE
jgi:Uma2 family endonuclease